MKLSSKQVDSWSSFFAVLIIFAIIVVPLSFWTQRSLEYIALQFPPVAEIPYWISLVLTIALSKLILLANIVVEVFRLIKG
jgi:uncharacterized Tic20 family protein